MLMCIDEDITSVAVGLNHTVFGTKSGKVYCCGDSAQGQCGSVEQPHYNLPFCVATFNSPVKKVKYFALCLTFRSSCITFHSQSSY